MCLVWKLLVWGVGGVFMCRFRLVGEGFIGVLICGSFIVIWWSFEVCVGFVFGFFVIFVLVFGLF